MGQRRFPSADGFYEDTEAAGTGSDFTEDPWHGDSPENTLRTPEESRVGPSWDRGGEKKEQAGGFRQGDYPGQSAFTDGRGIGSGGRNPDREKEEKERKNKSGPGLP